MKPAYIIIGLPGAGKDTQAALLASKLKFDRIDTGTIIGDFLQTNPAKVEELLNEYQNGPFPTELFIYILKDKVESMNIQNGLLLNMKPKSIDELEQVEVYLKSVGFVLKNVIYLHVTRDVAIDRAIKRLNNNFDFREPSIEKLVGRIDSFIEHLPPVLQYLTERQLLVQVDGELPLEEVTQQMEVVF